jgi:SAM-dependent methyltransferase
MSGDDLYRDPALYDLEYADKVDDVVFYARLAARAGGPVLELGCGTGRLTLPMARAGATVTGIDAAEPMLRALRGRLALEDGAVRRRVTTRVGDFTRLSEPPVYALAVLPFNALHHCAHHRDLLALLDGVRRALRPGGRFVLDCYLPDPALYARDPDARYEERVFVDPVSGERLLSWETGRYDPLSQVHEVRYVYRSEPGDERVVALRLRMFYPQELRAILDWAGFRVVDEAEDFEGSPLHEASLKWVLTTEPLPR